MIEYTSKRYIDGKVRQIIIDENGKIINRNPSREELKGLKKEIYVKKVTPRYYNRTNLCDRCGISFEKMGWGNPQKEYDENEEWTGKWDCPNCRQKYDPNSQRNKLKSIANCRTGNQNPDHKCTKGDEIIDLACELYGYINLNDKYDKYNTEIDCQDPKTGLLYQIMGKTLVTLKKYKSKTIGKKVYNEGWGFGHLERELYKEYQEMICFCNSKDRKTIENIYRFPINIVKRTKCITIRKGYFLGWYEQYRIKDEDELMKANEIWNRIQH